MGWDFTLQNLMVWGTGGMLALGGAGLGVAALIPASAPPAPASAPAPAMTAQAVAPPALPEPPPQAVARDPGPALPRLHAPNVHAAAVRLPVPPRALHVTRAHAATPAPAPTYSPGYAGSYAPPPARWQRTYAAVPSDPYYAYRPQYRPYDIYPGY